MLGRIALRPALRDGKAVDLADMRLEAPADVERAARLDAAHHRQHIGSGDRFQVETAEGRKGIALKPRHQTFDMAPVERSEPVLMPRPRRLFEGHDQGRRILRTGVPALPERHPCLGAL